MIDELVRLAMRLKGPFNIENVIVPIDVKISDAIMTFQENAEAITDKVSSHDVLMHACVISVPQLRSVVAAACLFLSAALLWPPYVIGGAIIFLPCSFFLPSFLLSFFLA